MSGRILFAVIGLVGGVFSGLFGVGGGIVIVPALMYWAGFSEHRATGTSLAVLLPPIGLAAAIEYWRSGNVDLAAAMVIAATMFLGSWIGARFALGMAGPRVRVAFGVFVIAIGVYIVLSAGRRPV